MQKAGKIVIILLWIYAIQMPEAPAAFAQQPWLEPGYAHNDYLHQKPLFDALDEGYRHIEADIFLLNGSLVVAHWFPWLRDKRTLERLYLAPLKRYVDSNSRIIPQLTLVIDIKSSPQKTYLALRTLLEKYKSMLSRYENGVFIQENVNIVITGHKPVALISSEKNRLVTLDDFLDHTSSVNNDNLFTMASCKYGNVLNWSGKGRIPLKEKKKLLALVGLAHSQGKKTRLWASPEKESVWRELLNCGVDYINTDKLAAFRFFYDSRYTGLQAQLKQAR